MIKDLSSKLGELVSDQIQQTSNQYELSMTSLSSPISILSVKGEEKLNQPWRYEIIFTSQDKSIEVISALSQSATFSFLAPNVSQMLTQISSLDKPAAARKLYGVITEFSQLSISKDQAHYRIVLQPRLALFANDRGSAIYQNQSVVDVVEEVLRNHGFSGVDYRLELKDTYPVREFITQWQESDLEFIQRLLADVGIWFRFESHAEHGCDVIVMSDYEQGFIDAGKISYKLPSGMVDSACNSMWDIQFCSKTVHNQVKMQDYNYRTAGASLVSSINSKVKDTTTRGVDYRYEEHYKSSGSDSQIESGNWYAQVRHQHDISEQIIISGHCNDYDLSPGQRIVIDGSPISSINDEGVIILSVESYGDRTESFALLFTAIPYNALITYRPEPLSWPQVNGTLPARVTSPDNDIYGYIDTFGRYRVKFNFDLKSWRSGEESLWVRLAKPYAGNTYGFHFPLIDGTEVAIAFTDGNPDRPYIAHAMHDSNNIDHVTVKNKHRNVIRTPANNKLRMDDKRGEEHIKLATEYGKTQLNIGHLVNSEKDNRGHGFELRTDEWGAIRAGKGLYVTTEEQYQAGDLQLKMDNAVKELEQAAYMVSQLNDLARAAQAELADLQTQKELLQQSLKNLQQPAILNYAPSGIADVTPSSIQQTAGENIIQTAQSTVDISAFKRFMVTAGNMISLFANKMGINIFASKGNVDIQAQNDEMHLTSKQNMQITSTDSEVIISASKKLTLACDGVAIILEGGTIKLIAPGDIQALASSFAVIGPASYSPPVPELPEGSVCSETA